MQASTTSRRKKRAAAFMHEVLCTLYLVWAWLQRWAATIQVWLLIQLRKAVRGTTVRGRLLNEGGV